MITETCTQCETETAQITEFRIKINKGDFGKFLNVSMKDGLVVMRIAATCELGYNLEIQDDGKWSLPILASDHEKVNATLNPCNECESDDLKTSWFNGKSVDDKRWYVHCNFCANETDSTHDTEEQAISAWNQTKNRKVN